MSDAEKPTPATEQLAAFLSWLKGAGGKSPATVKSYAFACRDFVREMEAADFADVTLDDLDSFYTCLALSGKNEASRRNRFSALRALFRFLHDHGRIQSNPIEKFPAIQVPEQSEISVLTRKEIESMLAARRPPPPERKAKERARFYETRIAQDRLLDLRDRAMIGLAYSVGLRAGEVGALLVIDYAPDAWGAVLTIRRAKWSRRPVSKRVHPRIVGLIAAYLDERRRQKVAHVALFPAVMGRKGEAGISTSGFKRAFDRLVGLSGIRAGSRRLTPHVLRYSLATHLFNANIAPVEIMAAMRHRSFATTLRYIRLASSVKIQSKVNRAILGSERKLGIADRPTAEAGIEGLKSRTGWA